MGSAKALPKSLECDFDLVRGMQRFSELSLIKPKLLLDLFDPLLYDLFTYEVSK